MNTANQIPNPQNINSSNLELSKAPFENPLNLNQGNLINNSNNLVGQNVQEISKKNDLLKENILNPTQNSLNSVPQNLLGGINSLGNNLNSNTSNILTHIGQTNGNIDNLHQNNFELQNTRIPDKIDSPTKGLEINGKPNTISDLNQINSNIKQESNIPLNSMEKANKNEIGGQINNQITKLNELNPDQHPQELLLGNTSKELMVNLGTQEQKVSNSNIQIQKNTNLNTEFTNKNQESSFPSYGTKEVNSQGFKEIKKMNEGNRQYLESLNNYKEISMKDIKDPPSFNDKPIYSNFGNLVKLDNSWTAQLRNNAKLDPRNEKIVMEHLLELTNNSLKMKSLIDDIFSTLNNNSNELSAIEFKEFYDLTAKGMNAPQLDSNYIISEFNSIHKSKSGFLSKLEMQQYVTRLYKSIINFLSKNVDIRQLSIST